ncbi:MAG: type II secretion system protein N [Xanthomonadaceae bacterium]|nr:type II secretion system protein N [Xanthomonadaceae bacterium]
MKYLRYSLVGIGVLVTAAVLLLWFLPARWALPWAEPQLHGLRLRQVHGLLWEGRAGQVLAADGRPLGQLHWQLSRRLLLGKLQVRLDFKGPHVDFAGTMRRAAGGRVAWRKVDARIDLAALGARAVSPLGRPRGELQLTIEHALLQGGWPLRLQAHAQWRHAVMRTRDGDVALGDLAADAQAHSGVIEAQLHDDGRGPLQVGGRLQLSPLGWRVDATLRPRQTGPSLRRWLTRSGPPDADGAVHIHRSSGLAGSMPEPSHIRTRKNP